MHYLPNTFELINRRPFIEEVESNPPCKNQIKNAKAFLDASDFTMDTREWEHLRPKNKNRYYLYTFLKAAQS